MLKAIGLNPDIVAKAGFQKVKKQLIEIARKKETGLKEIERKVVEMRFSGKKQKEAARAVSKGKGSIPYIESIAARKIRWQLKKRQLK